MVQNADNIHKGKVKKSKTEVKTTLGRIYLKNKKRLLKWATPTGITTPRFYSKDIPI